MFKRCPKLFALRLMLAGCLVMLASCGAATNPTAANSTVTIPTTATTSADSVPAVPSDLAGTAADAAVTLAWSASSGAASYHVKRATVSGGPYSQVAAPTSTSYTDTALTNGTTYYYVVSALDTAGESANSAQVSATPTAPVIAPPPPVPVGIAATPGNAQASLSWSASSGAASYHVKRATVSGGPYSQVAAPTSTSYTDTALTNGTTYYYVVSALDTAGESANSAQVAAAPVAVGNGVSAIVQWAVKDPNPGRFDSYDNGSGVPYQSLSQSVTFTSNTTSGNTLLAIATIASDGLNSVFSASDPVNGSWTQVGDITNYSDCNSNIKAFVKFNAEPLLTISWSGTGAVSSGGVLTLGSGSGVFRLRQRIKSPSTPPATSSGGDVIVVSLLSGTLGAPGSTYQLNTAIGATTFASEALTTGDFVSITRNAPSIADYPGAYIAEISGTDGSSVYFSSNNDAPTAAGTDTVTSAPLNMPPSPGMVVGFGFNGGINNSNPFPPLYAPNAGTGFTHSTPILQYDEGNPICTVESQNFSSVGKRAATFSPTADSRYSTVAVGFLDAP